MTFQLKSPDTHLNVFSLANLSLWLKKIYIKILAKSHFHQVQSPLFIVDENSLSCLTVASQWRHGVLNNRKLGCLLRLTTEQTSKLCIMKTSSNGNIFPVTGPLCGEFTGHWVNSPHKGQWRGTLMFSLICAWINGWVHNCDAGDLKPIPLIMTSL